MFCFLYSYGARCDGTFPGNIPAPIQFAKLIGNESICNLLMVKESETEAMKTSVFLLLDDNNEVEMQHEAALTSPGTEKSTGREKVITVGDVKTTMTIRGVRNRSPDEFGAFTETPGDFHTQGYIMQCIARIIGPGGFYYVAKQVLNRVKVTPNSFVGIFKEGNFQRNFNALTDFYWGVMMACVKEFQSSDKLPTISEENDDSNLMLKCFKEWLEDNRKDDKVFEYFYLFLTKFGSLLFKFHEAIRIGNGKAREACWFEMLPLFAAFNKKNYKNEAFVHIINFTALWPLAHREMFRRNCTVNAKGKYGHNFAIDEYMETFVVKPIKLYGRKQTTLEMLEKMCMNIELLEHIKSIYQKNCDTNKDGKSSVPNPMPDRIKVAWFALQNKWLTNAQRKEVKLYPHNTKTLVELTAIPEECLDVNERGQNKIKENFKEMLFRQFPLQASTCNANIECGNEQE